MMVVIDCQIFKVISSTSQKIHTTLSKDMDFWRWVETKTGKGLTEQFLEIIIDLK